MLLCNVVIDVHGYMALTLLKTVNKAKTFLPLFCVQLAQRKAADGCGKLQVL